MTREGESCWCLFQATSISGYYLIEGCMVIEVEVHKIFVA